MGRDTAEHHVRIGDGGVLAFAITCGAGISAGALGTHAQQSAFIHTRDRAPARTHGVDIEHGDAHGKAIDVRFGGHAELAVPKADVGRGAAHVESEGALETAPIALPLRRPRRRPRDRTEWFAPRGGGLPKSR